MNENYPLKKIILSFAAALAVPLLVYGFFKASGTGRLSLDLPDGTYAIQTFRQVDGGEHGASRTTTKDLTFSLPSGNYEVRVFSGNKEASSYFVNVPGFFGTTTVDVEVSHQSDRNKLARGIFSCPVLAGNDLYSYNCFGNASLYKHTRLTSSQYSSSSIFNTIPGSRIIAVPYQDGMLALYQESSSVITLNFIKDGQVAIRKVLPSNLVSHLKDRVPLLAIDKNGGSMFAISNQSNSRVLVYTSLSSDPKLFEPELSKVPETAANTSIDLVGSRLALFFGTISGSDTPAGQKDEAAIITYDVNPSGDITNPRSTNLSTSFEDVALCTENTMCLTDKDSRLVFYSLEDGSRKLAIASVQDYFKTAKDGIVYSQDGRVYVMDFDLSHSRVAFSSDNFSLSSIHPATSGILVNAFLNGASQSAGSAHTFLINFNPSNTNTFPDNKLPYTTTKFPLIQDMDYSGKTVLTTILLDSARLNRATSTITYDPAEFADITGQIRARLSQDGFSSPDYSINFIVSY